MFEGAVSYLLNRFLGKYVQNLDSSNLNVSIFAGDVELSDIQLRPEALVELDLPIEVKAGYVGNIKIDIPWTSLFSVSVVAHLEDVYILAGPITDRVYDLEKERALQNAVKRQMLESLEASGVTKAVKTIPHEVLWMTRCTVARGRRPSATVHRVIHSTSWVIVLTVAQKATSAGEDPGFFEKLYTYVINNIQVSIGRVHVRYEDMVTNPDHPFACGLMLKHISAYTTNSKWQPAQLDNSATVIYKLLEMSELSVYWNPYIPEQHLLRSRLNTDGWRNLLKQSIMTHRIFEEDFDFIIEPVSAETRLIISKDDNTTMPKLFADITLQEIEVLLSRQQFLNVLSLQDSFHLMSVNQRYRKYHPNVPLKISPRSWWVYAYTAVVEERIRPNSWERIKEHRMKYRKYKELFKKSLQLSPDHESIKSKLRELEEGLDVCNIVIAREEAKSEYAPEKIVKKEKEKEGWWDRWFGSSSDEEEEEVELPVKEEKDWLSRLTPEEKADLYKGIGYDRNANIAKHPKEYIEHKFQVNLKSCCLSLVNYSKKILQVSVTQMLGSWETRPAGKAFRLSCHTESFSVDGASIEHELVPIVTSDVNVYAPSVNQVFTLDFESNPLYVDADFSLKTNIQPVEVVYDEHSISEVKAFFQLPNGNIDVKTTAIETLQKMAKISQAGLIYAIEQHKTFHVAMNMKSPYIVIPEFGTLHRGGNVLIADLGMLQIKSELQPKDSTLEHGNLSESEIASRLYDQFNVTITDIKILLADSGDDWHTAQIQPTSEYHILPSMKLILDFYNSVKPDYKQLPQQKVITTLPTFEVNISDKRLMVLWKFFRNFPLPTSTSIGGIGEDMLDSAMLTSVSLDLNEVQLEPDISKLRNMKRSVLRRRVVDKVKRPEKPVIPTRVSDEADTPYMEGEEAEIWSKYEEVKAVDDISSTHNTTNIVVRIVIREVVIQLFKGLDKQENPYLMFRADRLRLDCTVTEYGVAAHASLGAIQLVDKIHIGTSGEYLELLSTKEGTDLVSVLYRKVDSNCPDFDEIYNKVEQGIKVEFQTLHLLLDQGAIMYLRAYIEGVMSSINSLDMVTSASTMVSSVVSTTTRQVLKQKSSSSEQSDEVDTPSSVVQFNIIAHLHDLSVTLVDNNSKIAEMHIRDLEAHAIKRLKKFAVIGRLRDIDIKDLSHGALYPNILMLDEEEESLFKFSFLQNLELREDITDNKQEEQFFDYKLDLRVGHLQVVALGKFYWDVMKFIEPFISQELIDTASVAMGTVSKQVEDFKAENKRFGLCIDMMSPTILIPQNSTSPDLILLKSGDLHVENVFDTTDLGQGVKQEWNHIYVSLTDVLLNRAQLSLEEETITILSHVLDPITFQVDLRLILEPELADVQTDISAKLDRVKGSVSQKDLRVIMGVLRENLTEGAPQPVPEATTAMLHRPSMESGTVVMDTPLEASVTSKKMSAAVLFTLEGMDLTLYQENETKYSPQFAQVTIGKISGTTNTMGDGEVKVTVALETISVSDTRPDSKFAVKKVLYYDEETVNKNEDTKRPLVSVIYKISGDGNQKADVMMEKVIVNVQIPYILELSSFFTGALTNPEDKKQATSPVGGITPTVPVPVPITSPDHQTPVMTVYCSVKQPEIVLFADPESKSSRILVMNSDIVFEYIASSVQQKFWSKITGLKMFSSIYGAPSSQNSKMLSPCDLEFNRCFNTEKNEVEMFLKCPKINIHLTPANLKLLLDVIEIMKTTTVEASDSTLGEDITPPKDDLWNIKTVKSQHWIDKFNEAASVGPVFDLLEPPIENFTVEVEEICAFFDVENLDQTVPLLCLRSSLDTKAVNWSKHLRLNAELEIDVCYYNEKLSVWEPLIEPNMIQEGDYKPWQLRAQMFQAQSFPIVCNYDDNGLDVPDGLQNDVETMISRHAFQSSSSENEADEMVDSPSEMTILRPKLFRRKIRINSDKSYESLSRHSSLQGESDSESEGLIHTITNKLGSIFTSDSSDADVSDNEDNDDNFDPTLDKPIFLTPRGPVKFRSGPEGFDDPDGRASDLPEPEVSEDDGPSCTYMILSSQEKLNVNVTPQAISVLRDVLESLSQTESSGLLAATKLPALEISNKLGLQTEVVLHRSIKVHEDFIHDCSVCHPGDPRHVSPATLDDNIITEEGEEEEKEEDEETLSSQRRPLTFVNQTLADAGHMLVSAGAFVFEDDVMAGSQLDRDGVQLQISGFDPSPTLMMNRACRKLVPLTPKQHSTKYFIVYDVDMNHSHKTVTVQSPLQLMNSLTIAIDLYVRKTELHTFRRSNKPPTDSEFTKLGTVEPHTMYHVPLYAAYHCAIYVCPSGLPYNKTSSPIWWPDLVQNKDRSRYFTCQSETDNKLFHIKVCCGDGEPLKPSQMITRTIPYFTLKLHPPVVMHNYLPYDLQFALEEAASSSSLTHGESTPLYTIDVDHMHKLNLFVADYLACDWKGTLEITRDMEEFKAIVMDTDVDPDNNNKHLSLSVHFNLTETCNLYIYSPYWIVNKTDLTFQIRGSMSDTHLECGPTNYPQLFRYKKNKRKKAKLKVYDSHWSHSFSLDTIGNYGVVECCDTQRKRKYTFMVQCQMSKLKLTKIITVTPFFLVVNQSSKALRYMEENKQTDLWFDLSIGQSLAIFSGCTARFVSDLVGYPYDRFSHDAAHISLNTLNWSTMFKSEAVPKQCTPFWPVTSNYNMLVKYERSNIVSQHFPFKHAHNAVLRMKNGTALCVSVAGGTQSPITITFQDYDVGDAPVRVENFCDDVFIKIHQKNQSQTTILSSSQSVLYTWDDPAAERTLMWNVYGRSKPNYPAAINKDGYGMVNLKLKSLKSSGTFDYVDAPDTNDSSPEDESDETDGLMGKLDESLIGKTRSDKLVIYWVSYLDHQQRVILFTQDERIAKGARRMNDAEQASTVVFVSLDGLVVSVINSNYQEVALLSVSSVPAVWEVEVNNRWKILNVELQTWLEDQWRNKQGQTNLQEQFEADLDKMQMLKPYMGALRRSYNPGLWLNYRTSRHHMSVHAKVQRIQLDNQLPDAYFPSVLYPSPTPVYIVKKKGQKPFIEVGLMRRTVPENNVDTFRYFKVLMQEFNVKIDKGFMMSLYDVFANLMATEESESSQLQSDLLLAQKSLQEVAAILVSERPGRIFFEYLRLSPLKMHVSFSLNGTAYVAKENRPTIVSDIIDFFLSSVGATLTEITDVELKMAYLEVRGASLSWQQLTDQIQSHYTHQAIQQAYVLILGLDVLGNPYGLIKDFTQGFGDLFYEPFLDSVQGSDEFADSLVRGVHSMLGNTIGGAAGSVAKITGSVGATLAAISFDQDYKRKRRAAMQQRPNLPLSLVLAGRGFVMGVCLGLSGIVLDPIRGAQEEGVEGFFKGVGKGIMGLLTKPAGGVFDMVSMAFDGVQRAAEVDSAVVNRRRKPRFINAYMGLRPYSVYQADGYNLLLGLNKGQYSKTDTYWAHAPLSPGERADMLLITDRTILLIQKRRCWGGWDIEWEVKVDNILGVPAVVGDKLVFKIKQDESSTNLFAGGEQEISTTDPDLLRWVQKRIENLMKYKQR